MEEVFIRNYKNHSDYLVWQYIGTPQGVMRTYPAMSLYPLSRTNFDVRKRPWYNAGIGCPKDVVVLVDVSGSMDGRPLVLMKATFKRVVEQIISDMDFIAAIKVGESASFLTCHKQLMRATKQTKNLMYNEIDRLKVGGTARWESGLNLAFQTLDSNHNTAQCEKAVVIMSDEITQPVDEIVNRLNSDKRVRVYSLSFRRNEAFYKDRLEHTACNHRGSYNKILSYGDIDTALQEIVKTGNEPLKGQDITPTWSNAYKDLGEVGMVVTATLPLVVDSSPSQRSITNASPTTFLGIVGLDFKASRIVRISGSVLPVQCVLMIVNNKGYPIYHPRISQYSYDRVNTRLNKFQSTKENNRDLFDLEKVMIDKGKVVKEFPTFLNAQLFNTSEDGGRGEESHWEHHGRDWYQPLVFQVFPLRQTPLSMAVIWTSYPQKYYMYNKGYLHIPTVNSIIESWGEKIYYDFEENACKINELLQTRSDEKDGDKLVWNRTDVCSTFMFSVLTDVLLSQNISQQFYPSNEVTVVNHFMMTYTGLIFFSNKTWKQEPQIEKSFKLFYHFKKSSRKLEDVDVFITLPVQKRDSRVVFLIKPLKMESQSNTGNTSTQISALGLEVDLDSFRQFLLPGREKEERRLLIDENGMIVMTSLDDQTGFLGFTYPTLFRTLHRKGVYRKIDYQECIHECEVVINTQPPKHHASSAFRVHRSFMSLLSELFSLLLALLLPQITEAAHSNLYKTMDCCKEYIQYQRNATFPKFTVESWCQGCISQITVSDVPKTNLILITDHTPNCTCDSRKVDLEGDIIPERDGEAACLPLEGEEIRDEDYYVSFQSCVLGNHSSAVCSGTMGQWGRGHFSQIVWIYLICSVGKRFILN